MNKTIYFNGQIMTEETARECMTLDNVSKDIQDRILMAAEDWVYEEGPRHGKKWRNKKTGKVTRTEPAEVSQHRRDNWDQVLPKVIPGPHIDIPGAVDMDEKYRLSPVTANKVFDVLVKHGGAREYDRGSFVHYLNEEHDFGGPEYRFGGHFGHGGKLRLRDGRPKMDYYPEHASAARYRLQTKVNDELSKIPLRDGTQIPGVLSHDTSEDTFRLRDLASKLGHDPDHLIGQQLIDVGRVARDEYGMNHDVNTMEKLVLQGHQRQPTKEDQQWFEKFMLDRIYDDNKSRRLDHILNDAAHLAALTHQNLHGVDMPNNDVYGQHASKIRDQLDKATKIIKGLGIGLNPVRTKSHAAMAKKLAKLAAGVYHDWMPD